MGKKGNHEDDALDEDGVSVSPVFGGRDDFYSELRVTPKLPDNKGTGNK